MIDRELESEHQLVVDNRKLLIIFSVLGIVCIFFYLIGYRTGKHQGYREGEQTASESVHHAIPIDTQATAPKPVVPDTNAAPPKTDAEGQSLTWYKNLNRKEGEPEISVPATVASPADESKNSKLSTKAAQAPVNEQKKETPQESLKKSMVEPASVSKPQKPAEVSQPSPITYSAQVGAFRMKSEVESKARILRAQGYDSWIEEPKTSEGFYLLKVGRFKTRAEVAAIRIRLNKSGFASFIKTN
jgi:cell division protein FtsN